ncbi:DNA-directed RNA polymerase III subunit 2 [Orobanche hederae]
MAKLRHRNSTTMGPDDTSEGCTSLILIQEQLSNNRIIIDADKKGCVQASVTSSTEATKSKTVIKMEKEKINLYLNQFTSKVPIMIVLKAMGMESDQEVVQMIGRDPRYSELLLPSIEDCVVNKVHTQYQALEYLEQKAKKFPSTTYEKEGRAFSILRNLFLANVPVRQNNFRPKCIYVAVMLRRMMEAILNKDAMDDKGRVWPFNGEVRDGNSRLTNFIDYRGNGDEMCDIKSANVGNFRLRGEQEIGTVWSNDCEDSFKSMNEEARSLIDKNYLKIRSSRLDISQYIVKDRITVELERSISTGNWKIRRFRMDRKGMTQVVARLSYIGTLGYMTRISPQFEKSRKVSGPRALQPSQWGMLCPCDTPEGESCGLVKNLALMTHVTTDEDEGPLMSLCYSLGVEDLELLSGEELHMPNSYLIIFNGLILGKHRRPQRSANAMRKLRRAGKIGEFVSIFVNEKQRCVYIASDGGRVCRPLVIADKGVSRIKEHHMKELKVGIRTFDSFLKEGLLEYLDVNEENNSLIALYEENAKEGTTHIEIEPFTILGVVAGLIPYPHHNQSPRNTYQCAMGKQAMGNIAYNQLSRMDTLMYLLVYPQRPLLTTRTIELVNYDKLGAGQNATVAVMSYSGYDIEDAIVMNKSSLDRGFGRCIVMKKMTTVLQKYDNGTSDHFGPVKGTGGMQILDDDGLAAPGQTIRTDDIYMNKKTPKSTRAKHNFCMDGADSLYNDTPLRYSGDKGETAVVDRVVLTSDRNNNLCVKFMIRHTRRPEVGDKFSSRHGQKGVCGTIVQQEDFPFSERGICPDLIMNPHGFPSRMTVGKMIELLGSKAGVQCGRFHYGSAFGEPSGHADKVETISMVLTTPAKTSSTQCITGEPLEAYIFMGPIYYQKLKHMSLRVGEMERDCLIAYGASMLIYERLMLSSDPFQVQVCRKCGMLGYYSFKLNSGICSTCKNGENMSTMKLPYACKLLFQELQSMNIIPRLKLTGA